MPAARRSSDDDPAVRDEVVEAEGRRRAQVDVLVLQLLQEAQTQIIDDASDNRHADHSRADRIAALGKTPRDIDEDRDREQEQHDAGHPGRSLLPACAAAQRNKAEPIYRGTGT